MNETIARLDRFAHRLGYPLTERGVNGRELTVPDGSRILKYKPGGKGIVRVEALVWEDPPGRWKPDAVQHKTVDQMEALIMRLHGQRGD